MVDNEKDTQNSSAVPQKELVSFMIYNMDGKQKERFHSFCKSKGFNYGPGITYLMDFVEAFMKEKHLGEKQ
jgi:hypothetical protein